MRASRSGLPISRVMSCGDLLDARFDRVGRAASAPRRAARPAAPTRRGTPRPRPRPRRRRPPRPRPGTADDVGRAARDCASRTCGRSGSAATRRRCSSRRPGRAGASSMLSVMRLLLSAARRSAARADRIPQHADPGDADLDGLPGLEREVVGRHEAGAGQQDAARGHGVVADAATRRARRSERRIRAVEVSPSKSVLAVRAEDAQLDRERLAPSRRGRAPPGRARTRPRRPSPAAGRAGSRPRCPATETSLPTSAPSSRAAASEHERRAPAPAPTSSRPSGRRPARPGPTVRRPPASFRKSSGPLGVVDERVDVLRPCSRPCAPRGCART